MITASRLKVGVDVPWVTSWSEEEIGVGSCWTVDGQTAVLQSHRPEFGRPLYSRNHFRRQRQSVREMLCPMCGAPTHAGDRWSQTARRFPAGVLRTRGLVASVPTDIEDDQIMLDAGSVAPGHRACMERSLKECPHLRAETDQELKAFPERWTITPMIVDVTLDDTPPPVVAIAFLQLCGVTRERDPDWRRRL